MNSKPLDRLQLPVSYEEAKTLFASESLIQKLMDFVIPLESEEEAVIHHLTTATASGKILFLLGSPGSGKSTFIESLGWRRHIGIRKIVHINASAWHPPEGLTQGLRELQSVMQQSAAERDLGPTVIVFNYLESLDGHQDASIKGFFRSLNGMLRSSPVLIIWPVVNRDDAKRMINFSEGVSGTMFTKGKEIHEFQGPPIEKFISIAETTIGVANSGLSLTDFSLTRGDLEDALHKFNKRTHSEKVIRKYLELVKEVWTEKSGYINTALARIPKFTEVWFVICHPKAEEVVKAFARRGTSAEDSWSANHDALYEYVTGTQRAGFWTARKLQMAINGVIRTRILYVPTNAVVAAIATYAPLNSHVRKIILDNGGSKNWTQSHRAQQYFTSTPLYRQLVGQTPLVGKRKSGPGAEALEKAAPAFQAINKWLTSDPGHDGVLNNAIGELLRKKVSARFEKIEVGKPHPWIPNVIPDIRLDPIDAKRHICLEFHFTNNRQPNEVADYCLRKMQIYLQQVEHYINR